MHNFKEMSNNNNNKKNEEKNTEKMINEKIQMLM